MEWLSDLLIRFLLTIIALQAVGFFWFVWVVLKYITKKKEGDLT